MEYKMDSYIHDANKSIFLYNGQSVFSYICFVQIEGFDLSIIEEMAMQYLENSFILHIFLFTSDNHCTHRNKITKSIFLTDIVN